MAVDDPGWSEASEIVRLFPTFLWKRRLRPDVHGTLDAAILARLGELRRGLPPVARGEAWQSGHGLHRHENLRLLAACIDEAVDAVLTFLRIGPRTASITACWANINAPGAVHSVHAHPNNFLSGVYYVDVAEGSNTIAFHDPRPQAAVVRPPVTALTAYNTDQVVVTVENGTMILFPAWLEHSVDVNRSERTRISVSFNVMFVAFTESMAQPLWGES